MLKWYPKLKMFKNSPGTNTFDGTEAKSYNWYVYARQLKDGRWIQVLTPYSITTSKHVSEWRSLTNYNIETIEVLAPNGLNDPEQAKRSILSTIAEIEIQLKSKRIRKRQERLDYIARLKSMLPIVDELEKIYKGS